MPTHEHPPRTKRKDAALNSERLVRAAREVFARQGLSATLEDIARQAGVGVGTVYRNFASKQQIVEALYDATIDAALADVQAALQIEDPWEALVTFFEVTAAKQAGDRGLRETFLGHGTDNAADNGGAHGSIGPSEKVAEQLIAAVSPLFQRAAAAGVLREGVSVTDMYPIFAMLDSVYRIPGDSPELWRRYLTLILDGLRATDRPELPQPAMDVASFTAALSGGGR